MLRSAALCATGQVLAAFATVTPAVAAEGAPPCGAVIISNCVDVSSRGDGWKAGATDATPDKRREVRSVGGSTEPVVRRQTRYAPTCTGNSAYDPGVLCNAAVETCPVEGEVRFWVWSRVFDEDLNDWTSWQLVDTVCLGADDPAIDPAIAVPMTVQREFTSVVVLQGEAEVSPEPDTLVNVPTVFTTNAPASYDIPLTLLGQSVVITATARRYVWHFGDGETGTSTAPRGRIEHEYTKAATVGAYVVIEWSGTFRVNGGASQPITGTATTTGVPTQVEVKQARAELVRD